MLPEKQRTCIYRVIQEATTNCLRHAQAANIRIAVSTRDGVLQASVTDDGVGLARRRRGGLGLRGIEERVRELQGTMTIGSEPRGGTRLGVRLPLPPPITEVPLARAAG